MLCCKRWLAIAYFATADMICAQKQLYVMEEEEMLEIAKQVASGMSHLASLEVVHGSLSTFVATACLASHHCR